MVLAHLKTKLSPTLDPYQFAYRQNRSTENGITTVLHPALYHLNLCYTYVRLLFIDFSSAFNSIIPSKLINKLRVLCINPLLRNWILDFLTNRPQHVRLDKLVSQTLILNTGLPQGCVLSPLLYSLFTHDCSLFHASNRKSDSAYREEVRHLAEWCSNNNLALNTSTTKEIILDSRRNRIGTHRPVHMNGEEVERVTSFKFLGVHISEDLSWTPNITTLIKKAHKRMFFLRKLAKVHLSPQVLLNFYRCTIESILTTCITVWYCNCKDQKSLQRVVKITQRITKTTLPT